MNVAEDVGNPRLVKNNIARGPSFVETEIKALALKKRKHVVEKRISVRKLHHRTNRDYQDMTLKTLNPLKQRRAIGRLDRGRIGGRHIPGWSKPQHNVTRSACFAFFTTADQGYICRHCNRLRAGQSVENGQHAQTVNSCGFLDQNKIPIIKLI